MIEAGAFAMGERVRESKLARQIGLSRTPIRAALNCLEHEGFLSYEANRGHMMSSYSKEDIAEIYTCRSILESEAAGMAAARGVSEDVAASLERLVGEMDVLIAVMASDPERVRASFLSLNKEFHTLLYAGCGNGKLLSLIEKSSGLPLVIRNYYGFPDEALRRSQADHQVILTALLAGQESRTKALVREHIIAACELMLAHRQPPE